MRVNFSVTNQLATPSIHAAALANRPPAGQPGRLFVDTDNPSSGIYRDTGTVWENITGGAGAGNLQTVTDAGNTTDNNILLTYADNTIANALVFYNDALTQEEYLIEKRGTGITTNDSLAIQSRGNISPSTNPVGFLIDGANDIVKSFYTTSYSEVGLKLDFANQNYRFGNGITNIGYLEIDSISGIASICGNIGEPLFGIDFLNAVANVGDYLSYNSGTHLSVDDLNELIKTKFSGNDIGIYLDFPNQKYDLGNQAITLFRVNDNNGRLQSKYNGDDIGISFDLQNGEYYIGDFDGLSNGVFLLVDNTDQLVKTATISGDIGLKLDFANNLYIFGDDSGVVSGALSYAEADSVNNTFKIKTGGPAVTNIYAANDITKMGDVDVTANGTTFGVDDTAEKLTASANLLSNTAGGTSGQHIKINIGGTDYKIKLENP